MAVPIEGKNLAQFQIDEEQRGIKFSGAKTLDPETRYVVCLIEFNPAVVSGNYPALAIEIKAIAGIVDIELLNDRVTKAEVDMSPQPDDSGGNPQVPREHIEYNGRVRVIAVPEP